MSDRYIVPPRESLGLIEDRARWYYEITYWRTGDEDGEARGVWLQALRWKDREIAERRATDRVSGKVNPWMQILYEVQAGIVEPADIPVEVLANWNYEIIENIYTFIVGDLADLAPTRASAILAQLSAEPEPVQPDTLADHRRAQHARRTPGVDGGSPPLADDDSTLATGSAVDDSGA